MATLQKFKLLAQCAAVAASPTRSPSASPVIHLRRRRTLRMLLSRATGGGGGGGRRLPPRCCDASSSDRRGSSDKRSSMDDKGKESMARNKLKDLFVSSPPPLAETVSENVRDMLLPSGGELSRGGGRSLRPLSATFRQRFLLRRAWRPVLNGIPE